MDEKTVLQRLKELGYNHNEDAEYQISRLMQVFGFKVVFLRDEDETRQMTGKVFSHDHLSDCTDKVEFKQAQNLIDKYYAYIVSCKARRGLNYHPLTACPEIETLIPVIVDCHYDDIRVCKPINPEVKITYIPIYDALLQVICQYA